MGAPYRKGDGAGAGGCTAWLVDREGLAQARCWRCGRGICATCILLLDLDVLPC